MRQNPMKGHKGNLPSPVAGMNMSSWLSQARSTENHLEGLLLREDLDCIQRTKVAGLLFRIRSFIAAQLGLLNEKPSAKP